MPLICLIGRHGSGKSTIGTEMCKRGFTHLSVGLLRRLAVEKTYPSDVPFILMTALRRHRPGAPLPTEVAQKFIAHAQSLKNCVVDGFPASIEHLSLLPKDAVLVLVWAPKQIREQRLEARSQSTKRIWTPGRPSERESSLNTVLKAARKDRKIIFLSNHSDDIASNIKNSELNKY